MCRAPLEGWRFQVNIGFGLVAWNTILVFSFTVTGSRCRLVIRQEWLDSSTMPTSLFTRRYFAARGEEGRAQDRPHFVYGDYQRRRKLPPETLARSVDEAWANSLDPLVGETWIQRERERERRERKE